MTKKGLGSPSAPGVARKACRPETFLITAAFFCPPMTGGLFTHTYSMRTPSRCGWYSSMRRAATSATSGARAYSFLPLISSTTLSPARAGGARC